MKIMTGFYLLGQGVTWYAAISYKYYVIVVIILCVTDALIFGWFLWYINNFRKICVEYNQQNRNEKDFKDNL